MSMLSKLKGNGPEQGGPTPPPLPAKRQRGEDYARALTQYTELQVALDDAVEKLDSAIAHIKVLEATLQAIKHDNNQLLADRDWHVGRYVALKTRLNSIASLFYDACREDEPAAIAHEQQPKQDRAEMRAALDAMEKELVPPQQAPA